MVNIHVAVLPFVDKMEFDETVLIMDHNRVIFIESTVRIVEHLVDTDNCLGFCDSLWSNGCTCIEYNWH